MIEWKKASGSKKCLSKPSLYNTEGYFGDIKENENFRRFNYRSADKVYKEFMLSAIGRNINKYCRFLNEKLKKFEGKTTKKTAWSKVRL